MELAGVIRTRAVQYDEVECRFMSVQASLQNKTASYLAFQLVLFLFVARDAFSIQTRFFGASMLLSLLATTASFRGLVPDLVELVETRHRLDLHDSVVTQIRSADVVGRTRLVGIRHFRFKVVVGISAVVLAAFAAVMLVACWSLVPDGVGLGDEVGPGIGGPGLGFCSGPGSGLNVTEIWVGPELDGVGGLAAPAGVCMYSLPEAFGN